MKKLILFSILLMGLSTYAQPQSDKDNYFSISIGTDIRNSIQGSKPTGDIPALDITLDAHAVTDNIDFNIGYELFPTLLFTRKYVALGYHFYIADLNNTNIRFSIQPSLEWSCIWRGQLESDQEPERQYSTPSLNINWNWDIGKHFAVQLATNFLPRVDNRIIFNEPKTRIVISEGLKIVYKIPNN